MGTQRHRKEPDGTGNGRLVPFQILGAQFAFCGIKPLFLNVGVIHPILIASLVGSIRPSEPAARAPTKARNESSR